MRDVVSVSAARLALRGPIDHEDLAVAVVRALEEAARIVVMHEILSS